MMTDVPPVTGHTYEPYPGIRWPYCAYYIEVPGGTGRACDRLKHEHAPASEEVEAGA